MSLQVELWLIVGYKVLTVNMKLLKHMQSFIQIGCTLLIDTYNTMKSGLPNAIRVFEEVLKPRGIRPAAVRIDSGDLAYLSKQIRVILDNSRIF